MSWLPPTLETERLILRPVNEHDAAAIYAFCSNPNMTRFTLWNTHQTTDDTMVFINHYAMARYLDKQPDPFGIILKQDPLHWVIGTVGCFWVSRNDQVMELGYNLGESYWGRGITVEACQILMDYVFLNYPVERLQVRILEGNHSSIRVAEKLGFQFEGTIRSFLVRYERRWNVQIYSLLRSEWQSLAVQESDD